MEGANPRRGEEHKLNYRARLSDSKGNENPRLLIFRPVGEQHLKALGEKTAVNNKTHQTDYYYPNFTSEYTQKHALLNWRIKNETQTENPHILSLQPKISIVIPCFNEEEGLKSVLPQVHEVMSKTGFPYEVIVVDDGSEDKTAEIAKKHYSKVLKNPCNQGKGIALQKGFKHAKGNIIITMDGDGSHKAEDIPRLIEPILKGEYELVIGSRFLSKTGNKTTSLLHIIGNKIFNYIIWLLNRKRLVDSQSGFRAFTKKLLSSVGDLTSEGYDLESEFIIKSVKLFKDKIIEVPIKIVNRLDGNSRIRIIPDGLKILKRIIQDTFQIPKNTNYTSYRGMIPRFIHRVLKGLLSWTIQKLT